jgi:hypothetical protein
MLVLPSLACNLKQVPLSFRSRNRNTLFRLRIGQNGHFLTNFSLYLKHQQFNGAQLPMDGIRLLPSLLCHKDSLRLCRCHEERDRNNYFCQWLFCGFGDERGRRMANATCGTGCARRAGSGAAIGVLEQCGGGQAKGSSVHLNTKHTRTNTERERVLCSRRRADRAACAHNKTTYILLQELLEVRSRDLNVEIRGGGFCENKWTAAANVAWGSAQHLASLRIVDPSAYTV